MRPYPVALLCLIGSLLLLPSTTNSVCTHKTLYASAVNFVNSISLGRKGLLASLFYVKDAEDCVRQCANYQFCYVAEFQRRGSIGFCDLYHYHYPNIYQFESNSSMRVVPEYLWPEAQVLYDIDCETPANKRTKACHFSTYQSLLPRKIKQNFTEVSRDSPALTVEECARQCAQAKRNCNAAIFIPPSFYSEEPLGDCKRFKSIAASVDKTAKLSEKKSPVLIGRVDCQLNYTTCSFKNATTVYGSVNDLEIPPDVYYLARNPNFCAQICGQNPDCVEVEFEHKANEHPKCLLFKAHQYPQALKTLHTPRPEEHKNRLTNITCNGRTRKIPAQPRPTGKTTKSPRNTATTKKRPVTQPPPPFPTAKHRSSNGRP